MRRERRATPHHGTGEAALFFASEGAVFPAGKSATAASILAPKAREQLFSVAFLLPGLETKTSSRIKLHFMNSFSIEIENVRRAAEGAKRLQAVRL